MALLNPHADFYAKAHPGPEDVFLVVEIAETSADFDRTVKVSLYAQAGIPEVWLVDLAGERLEVYRQPSLQGYQEIRRFLRGQRPAPHVSLMSPNWLWRRRAS